MSFTNVGACVIVMTTVMGLSIGASTNHPFRGRHVLDNAPLIDGHNDLPFNLYDKLNNKWADRFFERKLTSEPSSEHFDVLSTPYVEEVNGQEAMKAKLAEAGDKLVVVYFFARWCGPCKTIAPQFELLAKENPNVVFLKVDVDINEDLTDEYEIYAVPTFVFLKHGQQLDSLIGAELEKLKDMVAKHQ